MESSVTTGFKDSLV